MLRRIEDDRHVGRSLGLLQPVGELPQHRRVAVDRADVHAVPVRQRRKPVIGAENVARPVDEIEVVLDRLLGRGRFGGFDFGHERAGLAG